MAHAFTASSLEAVAEDLTRRKYYVGLDLGQSVDPSAVAILETVDAPDIKPNRVYNSEIPYFPTSHHIRHLERLKLGMSYVEQAGYVHQLMHTSPLQQAELIIDATGVGRACLDLFCAAGLRPIGVSITSGDSVTRERLSPNHWHVAKIQLISPLQAALHSGDLKIAADLPETQTLISELSNFQASFTASGYAKFGARQGKHDDLVLACAIALWWSKESTRHKTVVREFPFD